MIKIFILSTLLATTLLFPGTLLAEKQKKVKFGKPDEELVKMTVYEKDSSANAVVLYDNGKSELNFNTVDGWKINFSRHQRIKVLKKEGVGYGDFRILLYGRNTDTEDLIGLKAITYNIKNGAVVATKLEKKDVYKEQVNDNLTAVSFSMPDVKEGSLIEVKYNIGSTFLFNLQNWSFQRDIPVKHSEYMVVIPEYFHYKFFAKGHEQLASYTTDETRRQLGTIDYRGDIHHWIAKDMPAFKTEAYTSSTRNFIQQMTFELSSFRGPDMKLQQFSESWKSINEKLWKDESFGILYKKEHLVKDIVPDVISDCKNDEEKVEKIYAYVKENMKWDKNNHIYSSNLRKAFKEKRGTVADINHLLTLMLREAGLDAYPLILSTRSNGLFLFPTLSGFNYVVSYCKIGEKELLLDATEENCGMNLIPHRCLNERGMVIGGSAPHWVSLSNHGYSSSKYLGSLSVDESGVLTVGISKRLSGYSALNKRNRIEKSGSVEKYKEEYIASKNEWDIEEISLEGIEQLDKGVTEKLSLSIDNYAMAGDDYIYVSPLPLGKETENPFKLEERKYPVDFGNKFSDEMTYTLEIPEGYSIEEIPQPINIKLPENGGSFLYVIKKVNEKTVQIVSRLKINKPIFLPTEYQYLKQFYNKIIEKHNELVVLKKI